MDPGPEKGSKMTARKNTTTAVSGTRRPRRTAATKTTATGTTLALVDAVDTAVAKLATSEVVKAAESAPKVDVTQKPVDAVKVAEKPTQAPKATAPAKAAGSLNLATGELKVGPAEKPVKPAKPAKVAKPKLVVTDADLKRLAYVPDSQGDKAKTRHLDSCPAYFDARWSNATTFSKVTDAKRLAELAPCRACARRAASERTAK